MSSSAAAAQVAGPSKTSQAAPSKAGGGPLAAGKSSKAAIKRERSAGGKHGGAGAGPSSSDQEGPRTPDPKTLRRLAQNREAARKSRLRKKAYIQQLESGRIRLAHLEQEMQMARTHQGALWGTGTLSPDAALFNLEYERWLGDHSKVVARLRAAAEEHRPDGELRAYADEAASHYGALMGLKARAAAADPLHLLSGLWKGAAERCFLWIGGFRPSELINVAVRHVEPLAELKAAVARADAFHLVSGAWASAAERCFLWIGGFRPSELIKVAVRHAEPLTEPQAMGVCGVQQWAREAEAALDHELQAMHRSVAEAVSSDAAALLCPYSDVPGYMAVMSLAIGKLASLEAFVRQADALRLQALHRLPQILTARQSARCFLAIADYSHRLRALSELWHNRPRHEPPATTPAAGSSHGPPYQSSRDGLA